MRLRIQYKISLVIILTVFFVLFGVYIYLQNSLREDTYQRSRISLAQDLRFAKIYLLKRIRPGLSVSQVDHIADQIGRDFNVRVTIIGLDGKVMGDSQLTLAEVVNVENHLHHPEVEQALKKGTGESRMFSATLKQDLLYLATVFGHDKPEGILRLAIPLSDIEVMTHHLKKALLMGCFLALVFTAFSSFMTSAWIARPIKEISHTAKKIAEGDFTVKPAVDAQDEIGDLSQSVQYMSQQIRTRIDDAVSSKSRLEAVFLSMFEGVMILDKEGAIFLMNQTLRQFLHVTGDPVGKKPLEIIRNIPIQELADKVLSSDKGLESREISVLLPEEKILLIHATPVLRENKVDGAVMVFHDITELRRLENVRRDFVANVSHELRTPVSTIKGYAETLLDGALQDKKHAREFVEIIHTDADRLAKLVNDILDLSEIESGKMSLSFHACSLKDAAERVIASIRIKANEKSVQVKNEIPANLPKIKADETALAQILFNLVENAIKYNRQDGTVVISARNDTSSVIVDVADTGIGIPEEDIPRIFERFYRVDKAHSRQLGGTGLGLAIVKHLVHAHNGDLAVKSELDKGSVFSFSLPKV